MLSHASSGGTIHTAVENVLAGLLFFCRLRLFLVLPSIETSSRSFWLANIRIVDFIDMDRDVKG